MEKDTLWEQVNGKLNINELLKYKDILPCYFLKRPEVDGEYLIYEINDNEGYPGTLYKCKQDGSIIAVKYL